jgi:hypothetical protein
MMHFEIKGKTGNTPIKGGPKVGSHPAYISLNKKRLK